MLGKLNNILKLTGFQLIHIPPAKSENEFIFTEEYKKRQKILSGFSINKIIDIGANTGQFATVMRNIEFTGQIISFEPLSSAFKELQQKASNDSNWICQNYALGHEESSMEINIAGNSYSSSLLEMLPEHLNFDPNSGFIGKENINIKTFDSVFSNFCYNDDKIWMKIDTQGFEKQVLEGAKESLSKISVLQIEMSLTPLYQNEPLFSELYPFVVDKNFELFTIEPGINNVETGQLLQLDCIFIKKLAK